MRGDHVGSFDSIEDVDTDSNGLFNEQRCDRGGLPHIVAERVRDRAEVLETRVGSARGRRCGFEDAVGDVGDKAGTIFDSCGQVSEEGGRWGGRGRVRCDDARPRGTGGKVARIDGALDMAL